jgi:hypothetical protein
VHRTAARSHEYGIALLELSAWLVMILPLTLFAFGLCATAHDRNVIQTIPGSLMRETGGSLMTWRSDRVGGVFEVDTTRAREIVQRLSDRALSEVRSSAFKLTAPAVRACFWVYDIDSTTGRATTVRSVECQHRNDSQAALVASLERAREARVAAGIAEPIRLGAEGLVGYVPRAVLFGVSVGGSFKGFEALHDQESVRHAAVWVARGDVVL